MFEYNLTIMVSLIIGVSSTLKKVFGPNYNRYEPVLKLILGIIAGIVYINPNNIKIGILDGIIIGLAANGFSVYAKDIKDGYTTLRNRNKKKTKV